MDDDDLRDFLSDARITGEHWEMRMSGVRLGLAQQAYTRTHMNTHTTAPCCFSYHWPW